MEISRRHLQDIERAELHEKLTAKDVVLMVGGKAIEGFSDETRMNFAPVADAGIDGVAAILQADQAERAAEMQRQVDGLTRNQRRVLNKRMRKAAKK